MDALVGQGYRGWYLGYLIAVLWPTSATNYPDIFISDQTSKYLERQIGEIHVELDGRVETNFKQETNLGQYLNILFQAFMIR